MCSVKLGYFVHALCGLLYRRYIKPISPANSDQRNKKAESNQGQLFQLKVVNSYGSQEVQKLEKSQTYRFSS